MADNDKARTPAYTVGNALRIFEKAERRFRQIQAIEKTVKTNQDAGLAIHAALAQEKLLAEGQTAADVLASIRSDEFARLMAIRDAIREAPVPPISITSAPDGSPDGPVTLTSDLFRFGTD